MTFPDLTYAESVMARIIADSDTADAFRDPQGTLDDVVNPTTLTSTPPVGDRTQIWSGINILLIPAYTDDNRVMQSAGELSVDRTYQLHALKTDPQLAIHDEIVVTASTRDPRLVGKILTVTSPVLGSFAITQRWIVQWEDRT